MSKYSSLDQISGMLDVFNSSLHYKGLEKVNTIDDLTIAFVQGIEEWKKILESSNPHQIYDAYIRWMKVYAVCAQFISIVANAINLYAESGDISVVKYKTNEAFIKYNCLKISQIPHVQQYIGTANSLAEFMVNLEPGIKRINLAGLEATEKIMPNVVDKKMLDALRKEIEELDKRTENKLI